MSKINAVRIVNLNYNYNTMKIDDEYFELNGENTLFSLINGGGKTVIVQMIMAPFIHKNKRNLADRTFKDYFTTNKPTLILVEWQLDGGAGYVLTGLMVRKNQDNDSDENNKEELDTISFIYEYKSPNIYDIRNIPIIETSTDKKTLKSYQTCEKLFEEIKNKKGSVFSYYNVNNYAQQRNYFEKLEQYQIYYSEWETIIKKVNLKESGLSELFTNAKDERGLLEKWFLKAVEDKLSKNGEQIKKFEELMAKCIKQYKDNQFKILKKQSMLNFKKETESIYQKAISYQNSMMEKQKIQADIGELLLNLKQLGSEYKNKISSQNSFIETVDEAIYDLKYQSLCLEIILKSEELDLLNDTIRALNKDENSLKSEQSETEKLKNILLCAKAYEELQTADGTVNEYEARLRLLNRENIDLAPRRNKLGYALKYHYEKEQQNIEGEISELKSISEEIKTEIKETEAQIKILQAKLEDSNKNIGSINSEIASYNTAEEKFNKSYAQRLTRNILGLYEDNYLGHLKIKFETEIEDLNKSYTSKQKQKYDVEREIVENQRNIEDLKTKFGVLSSQYNIQIEKDKHNEDILETRKLALRYINSVIDDIFDVDKIKEEFTKKINELEGFKKLKERELEDEQAQYRNLELGRVLELSFELEEALANAEIRYVYGMDWLKNNGYKKTENDKILKNNPMLPYSLIMSSKEMLRLKKTDINVFTSEPVPILIKERLDLDKKAETENSFILDINQDISFYVLFNKDVLDKNKLDEILEDKKQKINQISDNLDRRKNEIEAYTGKLNSIIYQSFTKELYLNCKSDIKKLEQDISDNDSSLITAKQKQKELKDSISSVEAEINDIKIKLVQKDKLLKDLSELNDDYKNYLSNIDERVYLLRQTDELKTSMSDNQKLQSTKQDEINNITRREIDKNAKHDELVKKKNIYSSYTQDDISDLKEISILMLESEYNAITEKISSTQKQIEDGLNSAKSKAEETKNILNKLLKKYNISDDEYKNVGYDSLYEEELENKAKQMQLQLDEIANREKPLIKEQGKLGSEKDALYQKLNQSFETTDILAKEKIKVCDFKKEIFELQIKKEKEEKILKQLYDKVSTYQNSINALLQYEEFENLAVNKNESLYTTIEFLNADQLNRNIINLKRELKQKEEDEQKEHSNMTDEITRITAIAEFNDEFYKNPLKNLYECRSIPSQIIEQLDTIWKAYSTLLEKLQVDIDIIEKEKEEIVKLFVEYVKNVHTNLDSIDKNSNINIRGRSIKMLKIILPSWEDEEGTYTIRINEFVEALITTGINLLKNNEQIEEMLGKQITICNIYDRIVGCSKVTIRLYKIEANKEVTVTWAEAAKNSGGEGFLSAFVILSSLMMYLRRDKTDIFLEKEEGKVLIMDNPFAQTNAEHLLKPLIDISKKSNTQLISLTGLGGDSIYNRFDNIYVLNQTTSKLQNGITYLKGELAKGEENIKSIISSRVLTEEAEQITLF